MRQTLELIHGEWKWCNNPMLEEAMKHPHILQEGEEIECSVLTDEEKMQYIISTGGCTFDDFRKEIIDEITRYYNQ